MIFTLFGINIKVEFLFTAVVALLCVIDTKGIMWMSFAAVILHELGHVAAMLILKVKIRQVRLSSCGVLIDSEYCADCFKGAIIALAGPLVNIAVYSAVPFSDFGLVMLVTGVFNLIPITGTDGGDILRIVCTRLLGFQSSNAVFFVISALFSSAMLFVGIMLIIKFGNPTLFAAAIYFVTMTVASLIT